jgi:hypothetical protein
MGGFEMPRPKQLEAKRVTAALVHRPGRNGTPAGDCHKPSQAPPAPAPLAVPDVPDPAAELLERLPGGPELTPPQRAVLLLLLAGHSKTAAAAKCNVSRQTVWRWCSTDATFRAALSSYQQEMISSARAGLLALADAAVRVVHGSLKSHKPKSVWVAIALLRGLGLLGGDLPAVGSCDPEEVARNDRLDRKTRRVLRKAKARELERIEDKLVFG